MKKFLFLLFFVQTVLSMYPPADIEQSTESRIVTYERLIKSLHDSHISDYMRRYPRAVESQIFKCYFRAYAHRAAYRHSKRPKGFGFIDVAEYSLSYPLAREQADPVLHLMVKKKKWQYT